MRLPPTKIQALRQRLIDARLYDERNDPLIEDAVKIQVMIEAVEGQMRHTMPLMRTVGSVGQEKIAINPLYQEASKLIQSHARILWYLGLGNKKQAPEEIESENETLKELFDL